jgi:hypothetical protein
LDLLPDVELTIGAPPHHVEPELHAAHLLIYGWRDGRAFAGVLYDEARGVSPAAICSSLVNATELVGFAGSLDLIARDFDADVRQEVGPEDLDGGDVRSRLPSPSAPPAPRRGGDPRVCVGQVLVF